MNKEERPLLSCPFTNQKCKGFDCMLYVKTSEGNGCSIFLMSLNLKKMNLGIKDLVKFLNRNRL